MSPEGDYGCLLFTKKILEVSVISVLSFRSVNTVGVVYHLHKISGLSRRAGETDRLRFAISDCPVDTSAVYKMKENTLQ